MMTEKDLMDKEEIYQKGYCEDCRFYNNCPKMTGVGRCQNLPEKPKDNSPGTKAVQ